MNEMLTDALFVFPIKIVVRFLQAVVVLAVVRDCPRISARHRRARHGLCLFESPRSRPLLRVDRNHSLPLRHRLVRGGSSCM